MNPTTAFKEGRKAKNLGFPIEANPYRVDELRKPWDQGWKNVPHRPQCSGLATQLTPRERSTLSYIHNNPGLKQAARPQIRQRLYELGLIEPTCGGGMCLTRLGLATLHASV